MENQKDNPIYQQLPKFDIVANKINNSPFALEAAPVSRAWMNDTRGHAAKCLPLLASNQMGWIIRNPCDATAIWNGGQSLHDSTVILDDEKMHSSIKSHFGWGIITWQIPWLFRTTEGIGLMVRGCTNFWVENAQALDGFVETNWSPYTFTFNWKIIQPNVPVFWRKGDPVCMIIPYPIDFIEKAKTEMTRMTDDKELHKTYQEWSTYRDAFNANPDPNSHGWQKDYFKGKKHPHNNGEENIAKMHKTKFILDKFNNLNA